MNDETAALTLTLLGAYFLASFVAAALVVRFFGSSKFARVLRDHFSCWPIALPLLVVFTTMQVFETGGNGLARVLRMVFERLSGKRTRQRRTSPWY